jgi:hypothetical protein
MNPILSIYDATTPAELRAAVVSLVDDAMRHAFAAGRGESSGGWHGLQHEPELMVPPVPTTWRIVKISGQSYRCADGVLEYLHSDGEWSKATWVHPSSIVLFADLIANPT